MAQYTDSIVFRENDEHHIIGGGVPVNSIWNDQTDMAYVGGKGNVGMSFKALEDMVVPIGLGVYGSKKGVMKKCKNKVDVVPENLFDTLFGKIERSNGKE